MAGESARTKAERLARQAEYWKRGADGEEATATALMGLVPGSWVVIHDVAWPGRKLANIDHVVVGPPGVFVIDSKNWSGRVTADRGELRQNGYNRARSVRSTQDAALAVASLLTEVRPEHVVPVICFKDPEMPAGMVDGTLICSAGNVVPLLTSRPAVFSAGGVPSVADELRRCLPAATAPRPEPLRARPPERPQVRSQVKKRSPVRASVAAAIAALVLASTVGAGIAISRGFSDEVTPPGDQPTQIKDKSDKKKNQTPAKKKNQESPRSR